MHRANRRPIELPGQRTFCGNRLFSTTSFGSGPVGWKQILSGVGLVAVLVALASYYAWRQLAVLRRVPAIDSEESRFQRGLARRRLVNSGLMAILAVLLAGALLF